MDILDESRTRRQTGPYQPACPVDAAHRPVAFKNVTGAEVTLQGPASRNVNLPPPAAATVIAVLATFN
ncbi:hypothetical protein [Hoeflea sp. EC-HK425]|uniref:hypothetical protein n=1 Tax=Hoeflea sp. EC-HK425 TaxID=2038388 RepID=UPI00125AC3B1|nr:hypothetical protein [Hoeflea sp. EC-HK425]VVS98021.1 hypothetical protein HOE425_150014 [Hoeflea sp. EC-HK425]